MADLSINFAGISSPNPFWLASAPPSNSGYQVHKAFEAGWGGAVWKTVGPAVMNVTNRYGGLHFPGGRLAAINNLELISDRPLAVNLKEIREVKAAWPDRALLVSAMVEPTLAAWREITLMIEDTGADGIELNFGCPHGMSERKMGSAIGQVPEYCAEITGWVSSVSHLPVIAKLTPNVTDITYPARAALAGGASGLSLINTVNSIMGVDLENLQLKPAIGGQGGHGGMAGPAVKPMALHLLSEVARLPETSSVPISGMGGISSWQDAAEFILLGATSLQVCTAVMHYGFRIIEGLTDGLARWLDAQGFPDLASCRGQVLSQIVPFKQLDLSYRVAASVDHSRCIKCNLCYTACEDGAHQCIDLTPLPLVRQDDCVGCGLCAQVCPEECIEMVELPAKFPATTWQELTQANPKIEEWETMAKFRAENGIDIH